MEPLMRILTQVVSEFHCGWKITEREDDLCNISVSLCQFTSKVEMYQC